MEPMGQEVALRNHKWRVGEPLDAGGFASVHLASSDWWSEAVVKLIPKAPGADRELLFEDLGGVPNVVPVLDRGEWEDFWVLAMPKADMSLRQHLRQEQRLDLDEAIQVVRDVAEALVALENRVVHRDIKPENILLLDGRWCLADFGIARYVDATTATNTWKNAKSRPYAAPEQWREESTTSATDIYATGVVAYELLSGNLPFPGPDFRAQHLHSTAQKIPHVSDKLQSLIQACLYKGPQARPRPNGLLERLGEGLSPSSSAAQKLQSADLVQATIRAEEERQRSLVLSETERRLELWQSADQALSPVVESLRAELVRNSSQGAFAGMPGGLSYNLGGAVVEVGMPTAFGAGDEIPKVAPFEVLSFTQISVTLPTPKRGYKGRTHSLWYCDAVHESEFRWYETAFMNSPLVPRSEPIDPFAMEPSGKTHLALRPGMHTFQAAWPFTPIDQGAETQFVERWLGWFADAATGQLEHPRHMPEKEPRGSWRLGD